LKFPLIMEAMAALKLHRWLKDNEEKVSICKNWRALVMEEGLWKKDVDSYVPAAAPYAASPTTPAAPAAKVAAFAPVGGRIY
jgi:hypothetical protein